MNEAVRVMASSFLTTAELAARADFTLGLAVVSPSSRTVSGPGGTAVVEPRVMQVLVVLADAAGQVVTRETLFQRCWGDVYVGDDSLNRAIGAIRKLAAGIGGSSFEVETIPRTGYRLSGDIALGPTGPDEHAPAAPARRLSRRALIAAGAAAAAVAAGGGTWVTIRSRSDARFDALIAKAEAAIRTEDANPQILRGLEEAVAIRPNSAKAWGLLAFFNSILSQLSEPKDASAFIERAQEAAQRALRLDPRESNALLAMFELEGSTLDWFARDQRLRRIIDLNPANIAAIAELVLLLQAAGLNRESWSWNERAIQLVPLSLDFLSKRALKLWVAGRLAAADKVIDQVRALYPSHEWAWFVRFLIFAMTGRARAAQVMLDSNPRMIPEPSEAGIWKAALPALMDPSPERLRRTRDACFDAVRTSGHATGEGVIILSAFGDVDAAFEIANGSLLSRGAIIRPEKPGSKAVAQDAIDRVNMQWIWIPPVARMRADPRFLSLCDEVGLTEYWRRRGVRPDYQLTEG